MERLSAVSFSNFIYIQGFTFDLHHLVNSKSPQANFILEFSQAANLITKFRDLENSKKNPELSIVTNILVHSICKYLRAQRLFRLVYCILLCPPWLGNFLEKGTLRLLQNGFAAM